MNSPHADGSDAALAQGALDEIGLDRDRLAARFSAEMWWAAPAQALAFAAIIAAPAAGVGLPMMVVAALATLALAGIETIFRKRTGISTNSPSGPASRAVLIVLTLPIGAAIVTSPILAMIDERSWIIASTSAGFVVVLIGAVMYDRAYARDLLRGH